ncbi:hypothetical protein ACE2AJ_18765 [Aquihabitans daechungensis]|uniref:hypothetical protein n=1 Tax=Aquihabitans daechungensis TaxID=1052257 RepID=UPI003BA385F1
MVTGRARIDSLEAGLASLGDHPGAPGAELVVPVRSSVPPWLADLVAAAAVVDATVVVEAEPSAELSVEALDGWEIGVCTAALQAGAADVLGVDPRRVARVHEVTALLAAHAPHPAPEAAP